MRPARIEHRWLLLAPIVCAVLLGCGGKGGDGGSGVTPPPPLTPTFRCSDSPVMLNQVALKCGVKLADDVWQIDVVIGSPTTSTDIDGFAFNLLFDPAILEYVPGSARAGPMLYQNINTPLIAAQIMSGDPGRLVVGISRTGGAAGVGGLPGYDQVMIFSMKVMPGAQLDPVPGHLTFDMERSVALDSSDPAQSIPSITFSDQLLLSNQ
jgi:hypothetical protein